MRRLYVLFNICLVCIVAVQAQSPSVIANHEVFLLGDAGKPEKAPDNLKMLKKQLDNASEDATLIFLGDNIYKAGLADKDHQDREKQESKLIAQLEITKNFKGRVIMIPGNHDWDNGGKEGWSRVKNQMKFVKKYYNSKDVYFPKDGKPGPEEVELDDNLFLIVFDMQWMLHEWNKPLIDDILVEHEISDVLLDLNRLLDKHKNDHVILASHHPIYSYGPHGGRFPIKRHLFPFTAINPDLYIPLPILGSIYPGYRATAGSLQDIPHPKYKKIRNSIESIIKQYPNLVYVSGHEHSLQHIEKDGKNYVVSGSGSKTSHVSKKGKYMKFGQSINGFGKLKYANSESPLLEFWAADETSAVGRKIYTSDLYDYVFTKGEGVYPNYYFKDSVKSVSASKRYGAGSIKKKIMGENYRELWKTEVTAPIFNINEEHGGLSIIKKGGGLQTNSLRMKASDGKQYVLRSLEKYPERALPEIMQNTIAVNVVQDQMSASNPYGAFVVPPMAEAVGIYHTNPQLVYVPDDGALGKHRKTFANTLALYEERPAKDWSDAPFFGYSDDLVNSEEVLEEIRDDNDNYVDQTFALRNRMFDLVISDWDRHEDQWRWASFEEGKGIKYKPIPRDRDQTFFVNEGWFPKLASRKWAVPRIEGFNPDVRWAPGLSFNARHFDRWFLTGLDRAEWIDMAQEVENKLTDQVIENAIKTWPEEIYALEGEETIEVLKSRRDKLSEYSLDLYEALAREVEIVCTDKKELVTVENLTKDKLRITVRKISKSGELKQVIYDRQFTSRETKEVRIYGMDDKDEFKIIGNTKTRIKVRIIGGKGKDKIYDLTDSGNARNVLVYDKIESTKFKTEQQSFKSKLSNQKDINKYDRYWFKYDQAIPIIYGSVNPDDGLFVGGGGMLLKNGWRKDPYKSKHLFLASKALETDAFKVTYTGDFKEILGKWDLKAVIDVQRPFVQNFFGIGNDSEYDLSREIDFYRVRVEDYKATLELGYGLGNKGVLAFGGYYRSVKVSGKDGTFLEGIANLENSIFEVNDPRQYAGGYTRLTFDTRDEKLFPTRGLFWNSEYSLNAGVTDRTSDFGRLSSQLDLYYSFQYPSRIILASQTGYSLNIGDLRPDEFYNYNHLGGRTNLRGYRRTRFYGQSNFYQNVDLRLVLWDFSSILFPGKMGIHGFYDVGRVWDQETSNRWHAAAGGGVWIAPLSKIGLSLSYAFSPEEDLVSFDFGFFF